MRVAATSGQRIPGNPAALGNDLPGLRLHKGRIVAVGFAKRDVAHFKRSC